MKFVVLTEEEFKNVNKLLPCSSFYQTSSWASLKTKTGWERHYVGVEKDNEIICASMILSIKKIFGYNLFYAPRGFLIDFKDKELLKFFVLNLKKYVKKNKGIFLKIDPYFEYQSRDFEGNVTEKFNNHDVVDFLKELGFKHNGFNLYHENMQPRFVYRLKLDEDLDTIFSRFDPKTRQNINKNSRNGVHIKELKEDEISEFKKIMQHTANRRDFLDRGIDYYLDMYHELKKEDMIKFMMCYLDVEELINNTQNEINNNDKEKNELIYKKENGINKFNENKFNSKIKTYDSELERLTNKLNEYIKLKEKHGSVININSILYVTFNEEVTSLVGGTYDEFMHFNAVYTMNYEMIKYAKENGYKYYNFYGISGDFTDKNPLLGLFTFKKGFYGNVIEFIGEFDLITNNILYFVYTVAFKLYKILKRSR